MVLAGSAVVAVRLRSRRMERSLREQLNRLGHPICIPCGYDLRGQTEPRCPECGAAFDARLLPSTPKG